MGVGAYRGEELSHLSPYATGLWWRYAAATGFLDELRGLPPGGPGAGPGWRGSPGFRRPDCGRVIGSLLSGSMRIPSQRRHLGHRSVSSA
jgi:hypothetical protein